MVEIEDFRGAWGSAGGSGREGRELLDVPFLGNTGLALNKRIVGREGEGQRQE